MQSVDFTEAQRFLSLLGKPPGTIRLRAFYHAKNPKKAGDDGSRHQCRTRISSETQATAVGLVGW